MIFTLITINILVITINFICNCIINLIKIIITTTTTTTMTFITITTTTTTTIIIIIINYLSSY